MLSVLADIVDAGAVSDSVSGGSSPAGTAHGIDLNNGGQYVIIAMAFVILFLIGLSLFLYFKYERQIIKIEEFNKDKINEKERQIITKYRQMDSIDKNIVENTIANLSKNHSKKID